VKSPIGQLKRAAGLALIVLTCTGASCFSKKAPETAPEPPPVESPPPPPPQEEGPDPAVARLEEEKRKLELRLLEKESQVQDLNDRLAGQQRMLDEAIQEVVRAKAKLQSLESRAEAASQIAEAEIALKAFEDQAGEEQAADLKQIRQLLTMSAEEFEQENFGGSLYVSNQAKGRIQMAQIRLRARETVELESGEVLFAVPVSLEVTKASNVREEPSIGSGIQVTLKQGSSVTGFSHKGEWVRVKCEDGTRGWIHQSLLTAR
jgi:hypothetical protein